MSLTAVLRSTTGLSDLPRLVAELGHDPLWEELPPWADARRAATVGRHGRFLWIGVESRRPVHEVAGRIARRFLNNGCSAGVIVVYPPARELGIAAGLAEPSVLRLALDEPGAISLASLRRLSGISARSATAFAARAADVLDGRGIGHEFFRRFRSLVDAAAAAVHGRRLRDVGHRRSLALLQLTRVLFLYFVQSKGWLDGRPDFLNRAVDECLARRRSLQRQLFDPLFFGTLNRPAEARTRGTRGFGAIPFLNGGLFEPHPLERRYRPSLPDSLWRDAFDQLFERYHFTVSESESGAPSIAPDMLGRVFEGVMEPDDRRASGTFYTPAGLVRDLIEASCIALLASRLECSDADAAQRLHSGQPAAHAVLASATILDPACGSGAFLLGALERFAAARVALGERPDAAHRSVVQHQLFGVDLNGMAIRLAELRLWLAVVAQDDTVDPRAVRPLPNLDCLVRQGDSLHEPASARIPCSPALARAAGAARQHLVTATGGEKARLATGLRRLELTAAAESADAWELRARGRLEELVEVLRAPTLFGDRPAPSADQRRRLRTLRDELREARAARRAIRASGDIPWFHYESQFPDVMARGGFDIVIGNPPWVRAEQIPPELRRRLAARFHWWRAPRVRGFGHRPDLAVAFLERAHELVARGGVVTQLVPSKIATAAYGAAARESLARETTIHVAADLTGSDRARFGATVYPMALVTSRRRPPASQIVRSSLEPASGGIDQQRLGAAAWTPGRRDASSAAQRIGGAFPPFGSRFACRLGVKTGANPIFLDPPVAESPLLRPAIRGRDVSPFSSSPRHRVLWPCDAEGHPLAVLPGDIAQYLARHESRLRARADYAGGPYWTLFRTRGALGPHRIVWADLARELTAAVPAPDSVALNTCYVACAPAASEAAAACAWLNSTWLRAMARLTAVPASAGYARFSAAVVAALPAPPAEPELSRLGIRGAAGHSVQEELDECVASLLDLGSGERRALAEVARGGADHRR
jgi:hypothetical protein